MLHRPGRGFWGQAFPAAYQEDTPFDAAVDDIRSLEALTIEPTGLRMSLYRAEGQPPHKVQFRLLRREHPIPISDVLPTIENLGLKLISERPYEIETPGSRCWIQDFEVEPAGAMRWSRRSAAPSARPLSGR